MYVHKIYMAISIDQRYMHIYIINIASNRYIKAYS